MKMGSVALLLGAVGGMRTAHAAARPAVAPPPVFRISGIVHSGRDGAAIPHAHLRLSSAGSGDDRTSDNGKEAFSDDQGHFDFAVPGPGRWQLTTSARGFFPQGYDQHEAFQSDLVLTPTAPEMEIDVRIQPDSDIAGFVLDDAGEPVRGAQVSLFPAPPSSDRNFSEQPHGPVQIRQTDDRGHYDLSDLSPGAYRISVAAQPWYASVAGRMQRTGTTQTDPVFDVVYPTTWYPGATDAEAAATLTLHAGDSQEADFHLLPVPATHLRVNIGRTGRGAAADAERHPLSGVPQMERISGTGASSTAPMLVFDGNGQAELGGLSPGLYRVRFPGSPTSDALFLRVTTGSPRELDFSAALPAIRVSFAFDGLQADQRAQVTLTDLGTGTRFDFFPPREGAEPDEEAPSTGRGRRRFNGRSGGDGRTLDVPPGRYRVSLARAGSAYLTGVTAVGADVHGNLIDLRQANVKVTLHVETAPSTIRGICLRDGQPLSSAMVLLVPASLGQAGSIPVTQRDETNTDGSFDLRDVSPGQYILIAIDRGWDVNWRDPATLERYLLNGIPLSPVRGATLRQNVQAQSP